MAAVAERRVHANFTRLGREDFHDFPLTNGPMGARRGFAAVHDFLDVIGVADGIVFLVFLVKTARMGSAVTDAPAMWRWRIGLRLSWFRRVHVTWTRITEWRGFEE
jgi:hypothetical protein